jgi:hypothetical protein
MSDKSYDITSYGQAKKTDKIEIDDRIRNSLRKLLRNKTVQA